MIQKNQNLIFLLLEENEGKDVLPTIEIDCENKECDNREAVWWMLQTRSADEPTTQFFRCTKCKTYLAKLRIRFNFSIRVKKVIWFFQLRQMVQKNGRQ